MADPRMVVVFYDHYFHSSAAPALNASNVNYPFDELNRPAGKTYSNCPTTPNVTYVYDQGANGKGRRTSMSISGADYTQWVYDARGRVMSEAKQITGGGQFVTSFTYNSADLPVTMTYPDGEIVNFAYNNNMLPTSVSGTDAYAQSIAYDSANRMIQLIRGANKINTVYAYNAWNVDSGRLLNLTSTRVADGSSLQNLTYDYDSVGNINTIIDSLSGPQTQSFTYDELDRLLSSNVTGGTDGLYTEGYSYDSATGNLASKNSVNYTAYDANHNHAVTSLSNGNTYGYDQNGNMTSRHVLEGTEFKDYTLNYDAENRLVSVSGNATANFSYDGDGKQVKATVNGVTAVYVGNHYEVKNNIVSKHYFAGATRLAVRTDGTLRFLLGDHLGSSSVTTDANGVKTASALYKAFGETRYALGNLNTDYHFTGQREEVSLGIYFFNARWYDGSLGRFLSPDTIVPTSTQGTQAWDRYAFVNNNPVRYTDPTGHSACNLEPEECEYLGNLNGGGGGERGGEGDGSGGGGGKPQNSPNNGNGDCVMFTEGGFHCSFTYSRGEVEQLIVSFTTAQVAAVILGVFLTVIITISGAPLPVVGQIVGGILEAAVVGWLTVEGLALEAVQDELESALENQSGDSITITAGQMPGSDQVYLNGAGYEPAWVNIDSRAGQMIMEMVAQYANPALQNP